MEMPVTVVARGGEIPPFVEQNIRERAARLDRFHGRILSCRVVVEGPGGHHRKGPNSVRIELSVPGPDVVITRQGGVDLSAVVAEAFNAAGRRLEDVVRRRRGFIKTHEEKGGV